MSKRDRRQFMADAAKVGAAAALTPALMTGCQSSSSDGGEDNFVASGDVSQSSVVLWAHPRAIGSVGFDVADDANFANIVATATEATTAENIPVKTTITGLTAGTQYWYRAIGPNGTGVGTFRTPANLGTFAGLRFGASGDARGEKAPFPALKNVPGRDLDFFLFIGDTIYADSPSPDLLSQQALTLDDYRTKHNENLSMRAGLNSQALVRASTAIFATIDDHEVTDNFSGGAHPSTDQRFTFTTESFINETELYNTGLQVFQEYHPLADEFWPTIGDPRTDGKRKLYRFRTFGSDAAVMVLDGRSFRDAPVPAVSSLSDPTAIQNFILSTFTPGRTMLGDIQFQTLIGDLVTAQLSGITWKFVVVPEPISNLTPLEAQDRFEGYAAERAMLLGAIQFGVQSAGVSHIDNVVFISADIHGTVVNNQTFLDQTLTRHDVVGCFEIVTGSIASGALGPRAIEQAFVGGALPAANYNGYLSLNSDNARDAFFDNFANTILAQTGDPLLGLDNQTSVNATLINGRYTRAHNYGWTEFEVDATTQVLTVTTYGILNYEQGMSVRATALNPEITQRFTVTPQ